MDLKLNNSELNAILTMLDDALGYELEPLERITYMNIVRKINLNSRTSNQCVESFAVDILNTIYECDKKMVDKIVLTEEEWCLAQLGSDNPETYEEYIKRMEEAD